MTTAPELDPYPYKVQIRPELIDPAERADYLANREDERIAAPHGSRSGIKRSKSASSAPRPEYSQNRKDYPA